MTGIDLFRRRVRDAGLEHLAVTYNTLLHGNSLVRDSEFVELIYTRIRELLPNPDGSAN